MSKAPLSETIRALLLEANAEDIVEIEVKAVTPLFDTMFIATGKARPHNRAIIENIAESLKNDGLKPLGIEGKSEAEWILLDYGEVVVHVMRKSCRDFYALEKLWTTQPPKAEES